MYLMLHEEIKSCFKTDVLTGGMNKTGFKLVRSISKINVTYLYMYLYKLKSLTSIINSGYYFFLDKLICKIIFLLIN